MITAVIVLAVMALIGWMTAVAMLARWMAERERRLNEQRHAVELAKVVALTQATGADVARLGGLLEGTAKKLAGHDAHVRAVLESFQLRLTELPVRFAGIVYGAPGRDGETPVSRGPAKEAEDRWTETLESAETETVERMAEAFVRQAEGRNIEGYTMEQARKDARTMLAGNDVGAVV